MTGPGVRMPRALSLFAAAAIVVAACGGGTESPSSSASASASESAATGPTPGGTLYMIMTTDTAGADHFDQIDPQRIYTGEDLAFFGATIMQGLTAYKYSEDAVEATGLVPDAAVDTGTPNADATEWKFTLRDGMKWQDGSPVTCEDYKYGVSRTFATDVISGGPTYALAYLDIPSVDGFVKDEEGKAQPSSSSVYGGPYATELSLFKDEALTTPIPNDTAAYDKAVSCDGNTITFKLNKPVGDFNYAVTLGFGAVPNPKDHPGADTGEEYTNAPWSNGPYMIESYTPGASGNLTLVRNPNWTSAQDGGYRGAYPDKWVVELGIDAKIADPRLIEPQGDDVYAVQYGSIQPENLEKVFVDEKTAKPEFVGRAYSDYDPYASYIWIRQDKVKNLKIRQAMAVALDRAALQANSGGVYAGELGDGVIKPNLAKDYAPTGWATDLFGAPVPPNGDPELAKKLIAESGEAAPTLTYDFRNSDVGTKAAAIVKDSLEKAGFTVNLNPIASGYYSYIFDPEQGHDFGGSGWGPDWPNASTVIPPLFTPDGGFNISRVDDATWIEKVTSAISETDRDAQAKMWQDLNKEAMLNVYAIPTIFGLNQTIAGPGVGNIYRWAPYGSWPYAQLYVKQQ